MLEEVAIFDYFFLSPSLSLSVPQSTNYFGLIFRCLRYFLLLFLAVFFCEQRGGGGDSLVLRFAIGICFYCGGGIRMQVLLKTLSVILRHDLTDFIFVWYVILCGYLKKNNNWTVGYRLSVQIRQKYEAYVEKF